MHFGLMSMRRGRPHMHFYCTMSPRNVCLYTCVQIVLSALVNAQAPGDGSTICQSATFAKTPFVNTIVPLMDSFVYLKLLGPAAAAPTWSSLDVDGDTRTVSVSLEVLVLCLAFVTGPYYSGIRLVINRVVRPRLLAPILFQTKTTG